MFYSGQMLFTKDLQNDLGTIHYKFISLKTRSISKDDWQISKDQREQAQKHLHFDPNDAKVQDLMKLLKEKSQIIQKLKLSLEKVMAEHKHAKPRPDTSGSRESRDFRQNSQQKYITLQVKVNAPLEKYKRQNDRLNHALQQEAQRVSEMEKQLEYFIQKSQSQQRDIAVLRKKESQQVEVKKGTPLLKNSLKNSSIHVISKIEEGRAARQQITNRTHQRQESHRPNQAMRSSNIREIELGVKPSTIPLSASGVFNQPIRPPIINLSPGRASVVIKDVKDINNIKVTPPASELAIINQSSSKDQLIARHKEQSLKRSIHIEGQDSAASELMMSKRIIQQREDLKIHNALNQYHEKYQMLLTKFRLKEGELQALEQQLKTCKILVKKKDVQIRELKKQFKKSSFMESSTKDLKNRTQIQAEFEKLQSQIEKEKALLQNQIQALQSRNLALEQQAKRLRANLEEAKIHERTFQDKYEDLKRFTQKNTQQLIEIKEKANEYDILLARNRQLEGMMKIQEGQTFVQQQEVKRLETLYKKAKGRAEEREKQWQRLKKIQRQYDYLKSQHSQLRDVAQSFQSKNNELKRFCFRIEERFNKLLVDSKKKAKDINGRDSIIGSIEQEREEKEVGLKITELAKRIREATSTYYKEYIDHLSDQKKFVKAFYDRKTQQIRDKIYSAPYLSEEDKKREEKQKLMELDAQEKQKIAEINTKFGRYQKQYQELLQSHQAREGFMSMPQKLAFLEKKLNMVVQRGRQIISDRKTLKQSIHLQQNKMKQSAYGQPAVGATLTVPSPSPDRRYSANVMLQSMIAQNKQKLTALDEARQRNQISQQKTYEQNRKMNTQLLKENGELKMKNQQLSMNAERIERKNAEREKQLEQAAKKAQMQFKIKIEKLEEANQNIQQQLATADEGLKQAQADIVRLIQELKAVSTQNQAKQADIQELQGRIRKYQERIQDYQNSEKEMRVQVAEIRSNAQKDAAQLIALIQERSQKFIQIERTHKVKLQKLQAIISELNLKLEAQVYETMQAQSKLQSHKQQSEKSLKLASEKIQQLQLQIQSKDKRNKEYQESIQQLLKEEEELKGGLLDISAQIQQKQIENVELTLQINSLNKQAEIHQHHLKEMENILGAQKQQRNKVQAVLEVKIEQLREIETKFGQLSAEVGMSGRQLQRLSQANVNLNQQIKAYQKKYQDKQQQLIKIKTELSLITVDNHRMVSDSECLRITIEELQDKIRGYEAQQKQLHQLQSKNNLLTINNNPNTTSQVSGLNQSSIRMKWGEDSKFDLPSARRRPSKKQTEVFQQMNKPQMPNEILGRSQIASHEIIQRNELQRVPQLHMSPVSNDSEENPDKQEESQGKLRIPPNLQINPSQAYDDPVVRSIRPPPSQVPSSPKDSQINIVLKQQNLDKIHSQAFRIQTQEAEMQQSGELKERVRHLQEVLDERQKNIEEMHNYITQLQRQIKQYTESEDDKIERPSGRKSSLRISAVSRKFSDNEIKEVMITHKDLHQTQRDLGQQLPIQKSSRHLRQQPSNLRGSRLAMNPVQTEFQQKYQAAQIEIQKLTDQLTQVKMELQQEIINGQQLIQQAELCRDTIEQLEQQSAEKDKTIQLLKQLAPYKQRYLQECQKNQAISSKAEEITIDSLDKDKKISALLEEAVESANTISKLQVNQQRLQQSLLQLQTALKEKEQSIKGYKIEYCKYEEESELQITRLKETIDDLKGKLKQKDDQIELLGQNYIDLQENSTKYQNLISDKEKAILKQGEELLQLKSLLEKKQEELDSIEESKKSHYRAIKTLEKECMDKAAQIKNLNADTGMMIKKYEIRLQASQEEVQRLAEKIKQKQNVIVTLKHQIAHYNDQCEEVKNLNSQLQYQNKRVESHLKDIMHSYEQQIGSLKKDAARLNKQLAECQNQVVNKQKQVKSLQKLLRQAQREIERLRNEGLQMSSTIEKLKQVKQRQYNEIYTNLQLQINQTEKHKTSLEKVTAQLNLKASQVTQTSEKNVERERQFRNKLNKYEQMLAELQSQYKQFEERPTVEQFEELLFNNQLYKERIKQLEEQLSTKPTNLSNRQEHIYNQFKRYKISKERQTEALKNQIEQYGRRLNEMQEHLFQAKKEQQFLRTQNSDLQAKNQILNFEIIDLQQELRQQQQDVQFYKSKKLKDWQQLLNDTR